MYMIKKVRESTFSTYRTILPETEEKGKNCCKIYAFLEYSPKTQSINCSSVVKVFNAIRPDVCAKRCSKNK